MARRPIKFKTCPTCSKRWEIGDFHPKEGICWRCWDEIHIKPVERNTSYLQSSARTTMQRALAVGREEL